MVFIDETGDHNLVKIDLSYPVFGLGALLITEEEYSRMDSAVRALKKEFFEDSETFILHSSELKRPVHKESDLRNGIMVNATTRAAFYKAFDARVVSACKYTIVACFIGKRRMVDQYIAPDDPYHFSFENILNRVIRHGGEMNYMLAEKRGRELDAELFAEYERLSKVGIKFHTPDQVVARTTLRLVDKKENVNGLQVIDLVLSCLARHYLGKTTKMIGNDLSPHLLQGKYACQPTFFPYRRAPF